MDSTFKSAGKATLTDHHHNKSKELRGGILSMLNEKGEIVAWVSHIGVFFGSSPTYPPQ